MNSPAAESPSPPAFEPQLAVFPEGQRITGAASSGGRFGGIDPDDYAADLLTTHEWSGLWLLAYMMARFGFPNRRSDPDKNLCSWALTTPMEGVWLTVTPYMDQDGSRAITEKDLAKDNIFRGGHALQFGYMLTEERDAEYHFLPPALQAYFDARLAFVHSWWDTIGHQRFAFIAATAEEFQQHTCVWKYGRHTQLEDHSWGLFVRTPELEAGMLNDDGTPASAEVVAKCLSEPLHPRIASSIAEGLNLRMKTPQLDGVVKDESPLFTLEGLGMDAAQWPVLDREQMEREGAAHDAAHVEPIRQALRATLKDLLRPVWVRDVAFNALGRCFEGGYPFSASEGAQSLPENIRRADRFAGAGWPARAWYERGEKQTDQEEQA